MTTTNQRTPLYRPPVSRLWWLQRWSYLLFVLRELSSVFTAWFVIFLLLFVRAVGDDEAAYERFLDWAANPFVIVVNVVAFAFVVLHAITWFNLAPQAIVIRMRGRRVPARVIAISQYAGWAVVSAAVAWLLVGS